MTSTMHIFKYPHRKAQKTQLLLKIKFFDQIEATQLSINVQSYFTNIKVTMLMQKSFQLKKQQEGDISFQDQEIQQKCQHDDDYIDNDVSQEYIINVIDASSIFESKDKQLKFDQYISMKMLDKPKQSLNNILQKKYMFWNYIGEYARLKENVQENKHEVSHQRYVRQKQLFKQHSFYKSLPHLKVIFIKVVSNKLRKCNIQVYTINGEVIKYLPNILQKKKNGKIKILISQYCKSVIILHDYTVYHSTTNSILTSFSSDVTLLYTFFNIGNHKSIQQIRIKLKQKLRAQLQYQNDNISIRTQKMIQLNQQGYQSKILDKIKQNNHEQQAYLKNIRGQKIKYNIIFAFDAIIINLWRQYDCNRQDLIDMINKLFNSKQNQIQPMIIENKKNDHKAIKMSEAKNCVLCVSRQPSIERPRRTYKICPTCSEKNEKPIYLCEQCFDRYHTSQDVFIFKKYQKKTRQLKQLAKKKNSKIFEDVRRQDATNPEEVINEHSSPSQIAQSLKRDFMECLSKIEDQINDGNFSFAQFNLQTLMNSIIKSNNKHIEKMQRQ